MREDKTSHEQKTKLAYRFFNFYFFEREMVLDKCSYITNKKYNSITNYMESTSHSENKQKTAGTSLFLQLLLQSFLFLMGEELE